MNFLQWLGKTILLNSKSLDSSYMPLFLKHSRTLYCNSICFKHKTKSDRGEKDKQIKESEYLRKYKELPFFYNAWKEGAPSEPPFLHVGRPSDVSVDTEHVPPEHERIMIIQPNFKHGVERFKTKYVNERLAEAKALVDGVENWSVHGTIIESIRDIHPKHFFGTGKLDELCTQINKWYSEGVTMVFVNTEQLSPSQISHLERQLGFTVCDRYRVALEILKANAKSPEAKLQVQLAELKYQKSKALSEDFNTGGGNRGGFNYTGGSGETPYDKFKTLMKEKEFKLQKKLENVRFHRELKRDHRVKSAIPLVAVVGYTNAGKTALTKILSDDGNMEPEDKLFATLDTTIHSGSLFKGMDVLYIDTVGFISDMPHDLIESFQTTLEDVKNADVILHVWDVSHPECDLQKETVLNVLGQLNLPPRLSENIIEVRNKVDLINKDLIEDFDDAILVSCVDGTGLNELRDCIEKRIMDVTHKTLHIVNFDQARLEGGQYGWLYKHGSVVHSDAHENGSVDIHVILDKATASKFEAKFQTSLL